MKTLFFLTYNSLLTFPSKAALRRLLVQLKRLNIATAIVNGIPNNLKYPVAETRLACAFILKFDYRFPATLLIYYYDQLDINFGLLLIIDYKHHFFLYLPLSSEITDSANGLCYLLQMSFTPLILHKPSLNIVEYSKTTWLCRNPPKIRYLLYFFLIIPQKKFQG